MLRSTEKKIIIFTDLDGTLLDHRTYSYQDALPALRLINGRKIPLVFVTSKTRAEVEVLDKRLATDGLARHAPFVFENGCGISIPTKEFNESVTSETLERKTGSVTMARAGDSLIISFGRTKTTELVRILKNEIAPLVNGQIITRADLTAEQFATDSDLPIDQAQLALEREFDELFKIEPDQALTTSALAIVKKHRLSYTKGGRYHHLLNRADKGRAVKIIADLYRQKFGLVKTLGIGDSQNDLEFLAICDRGYLLRNPLQSVAIDKIPKNIINSKASGPAGWNKIVIDTLSSF